MSKIQTLYTHFLDYTGLEIVISYFKKRFAHIEKTKADKKELLNKVSIAEFNILQKQCNDLEEYVKTITELVDCQRPCRVSDFSNDFNFNEDYSTPNTNGIFTNDFNLDFKTVSTYKSSIIDCKKDFNNDYNTDFNQKLKKCYTSTKCSDNDYNKDFTV